MAEADDVSVHACEFCVSLFQKNLDRKVSCITDLLTLLGKNALLEYFNERDSTN